MVYNAGAKISHTQFVYALPYTKGRKYFVVQGYHSLLSHKGNYAIDFKMPERTPIMAARGGVISYVRESKIRGGVGRQYVGNGNGISILHSDGTYAHYWHLCYNGALVQVGDTVKQGQHIGYSGSTGFSAFPHLHFEVTENNQISRRDIPVMFATEKGIIFLQPLRRYKAI